MLGRVFDVPGRPRDGFPPPMADARVDIHGAPLNPTARAYTQDFMETGISAIDGMNNVVRGQELPIFSRSGLPHNELAAQIALQARIADESENFAVVFVAPGVSHDAAAYFQQRFEESGLLDRSGQNTGFVDSDQRFRLEGGGGVRATSASVKALENLLIPKYQAAIRRIQAILDEQERESVMRTNRVKEQ